MENKPTLAIEDMIIGATYVKCPNDNCDYWNDDSKSCLRDCPSLKGLVRLVKCWACAEIIELPADRPGFMRLRHECNNQRSPMILETGRVITFRGNLEYVFGTGDIREVKDRYD